MALVGGFTLAGLFLATIEKKRGPSDNLIDAPTGNLKFHDLYALSALRKEREVLFVTNFVLRNEIRADNELAAALLMAFFDNASPSDLLHLGTKCHRKCRIRETTSSLVLHD